ncbi:MAG TPA: DUF2442 domain-containing protein [Longimicrobiaceae bacterium]|nr:DUF2442 domain-containing protein [Longimicrobiaceae bacterium]
MAKTPTAAEVRAARKRAREEAAVEPRAQGAWFDTGLGIVLVKLRNGCVFGFPPEAVRELADAPVHLIDAVEVDVDGEALHWEALDADVSVPGLIARMTNLKAWAPKYLGQSTSPAKAKAARENGRKGGRPPAKRL